MPKVYVPYHTEPGRPPREIEIERRRRRYLATDIAAVLRDQHGIDLTAANGRSLYESRIPLDLFDDTEFDERTPEDWLALTHGPNDSTIRVPCRVLRFAPTGQGMWAPAHMVDYSADSGRFRIEFDTDGEADWLPRLRVLFAAENPEVHARRIATAFHARQRAEVELRYNLYIDCMPTEGVAPLLDEHQQHMVALARRPAQACEHLMQEIVQLYGRSINRRVFDDHLSEAAQQSLAEQLMHGERQRERAAHDVVPARGTITDVPAYSFDEALNAFRTRTVYSKAEAVKAMQDVLGECQNVLRAPILNVDFGKAVKLSEFESKQVQFSTSAAKQLNQGWVAGVEAAIRNALRHSGKGWFNIEERNREVYESGKLKSMMRIVCFLMQDTLRYAIEDSLDKYARLFEDAVRCEVIIEDTHAVRCVRSAMQRRREPLFAVDLSLKDRELVLSTPLQQFQDVPVDVIDKGLALLGEVPQVEHLIMRGMYRVSRTPTLASVSKDETVVREAKSRIMVALSDAVAPLRQYVKAYERFRALIDADVDAFAKSLDALTGEAVDVADLRRQFDRFQEQLTVVRTTIPTAITVGVFSVQCGSIRDALAKKCEQMAALIPGVIAKAARVVADDVSKEYAQIASRLKLKATNIEELSDLKEFMRTVAQSGRALHARFQQATQHYETLEWMRTPLSGDDFRQRWNAYGWQQRIEQQLDELEQAAARDRALFEQQMVNEQDAFEEELKSLTSTVLEFNKYDDINAMDSVNDEVQRINAKLADLEVQARKFNAREALFERDVTDYGEVAELARKFEPFASLWVNASQWRKWHASWLSSPLLKLDPEQMDRDLKNAWKSIFKAIKVFRSLELNGCLTIAETIKNEMDEFMPRVPLVQRLCNPGMRDRHWSAISEQLTMDFHPDDRFTLSTLFSLNFTEQQQEVIGKVSDVAAKEYGIEQALDKMENEWKSVAFDVIAYKSTGTYVMRGTDEIIQQLDDHIVMTQSMSFSPFKKVFEERIAAWEKRLLLVSEIIEQWLVCQRSWLYLEPIFGSEDIMRQLPVEGKRFLGVDRIWRKTMGGAFKTPHVLTFCDNEQLLKDLTDSNKMLDTVQKGLNQYLETKRAAFARFYFLSNDELLEILSQTKDPNAVQPHLRKCFEAIHRLKFEKDLQMTSMISAEGEVVPFVEGVYPRGNVENWLGDVERMMTRSVRHQIVVSLEDYAASPRTDWILRWPGQIVLAVSQTFWTREVEAALAEKGVQGPPEYYDKLVQQLDDLTRLVRGKLDKLARITLGALITIDVHARDVVRALVEAKTSSAGEFEWVSQMRYYWEGDECIVKQVQTSFAYGYEYLGNSSRLVITPLTDRIYMTLMGALHLHLGGAPAGPAGTGKTETTKDLAKALAKQCVVFNCSDGLDYLAMGKFFKGLASAGAWACFDEFNRIDIEVLSVIAQQISTIQRAILAQEREILFEGTTIKVDAALAIFITMNPGYAGRTELPDNLKVLFRPVACMVPDYALIAEIRLFSFGFSKASALARKMVATFKLSSEQLSSQEHYDFGMRAVNTVIANAGNLKRQFLDMNEDQLLLRALRDSNLPKFLPEDIVLFNGIVSDLFPGVAPPAVDYESLEAALREGSRKLGVQPTEYALLKCIQLWETTVVRHGLMLVGPTGGGKTTCLRTMGHALQLLDKKDGYNRVDFYSLNPKSITMGQLYGAFDENTHEWSDGIAALLVRECAADTTDDLKWIIFDGPVDALWIENMNTVLDDNKKLCLVSGEIIALTPRMRIIFEVEDLAVASPATVSRCGMVYVDPVGLGVAPLVKSYLERLPQPHVSRHEETLAALFDKYLVPSLEFLREKLRELVPTFNNALFCSMANLLDCFFEPFIEREGAEPIGKDKVQALAKNIEPLFIFALLWSVGATGDAESREKFDAFVRGKLAENRSEMTLPSQGLLYDYLYDQDKKCWIDWAQTQPEYKVDTKKQFAEIIVPTPDSTCYTYLLDILLRNHKQVLCVGPTGTGKTVTVVEKLIKGMPSNFDAIFMAFSAQTSANVTQDLLDSKFDKRRKGVFGAPAGKHIVIFVDDLNMPAREVYGAQPPIELLRQWLDFSGWYDRKERTFMKVIDIQLVTAMGPPGGGRNPITNRLVRHFNVLSFTELKERSLKTIFNTILLGFLGTGAADVVQVLPRLTDATVDVYDTIARELRPTPSKSHYTFNLRDVSKVIGGVLSADAKAVGKAVDCIRLWIHESTRVFSDRLVDNADRAWFRTMVGETLQKHFKLGWDDVVKTERVLYGSLMNSEGKYLEMPELGRLQKVVEDSLEDYNAVSSTPMKLVMFMDAVEHVCRISRVLRNPEGHVLLLGVGGSGRQSLTRLAAHMNEFDVFQVEIAKNYGKNEWRDDLKKVMRKAGLDCETVVFLFTDTQIVHESFLEDINNILNTGEVANLWAADEMEGILGSCRPQAIAETGRGDRNSVYGFFVRRCKRFIHMVLAMSPIGEVFRNRLRKFPSLVNCCTIDWFAEWPDQALRSVATDALSSVPMDSERTLESVISMCVFIHLSVAKMSERYLAEMRRHNYVTPTSYLELLNQYKTLLERKRVEVGNLKKRLENGLSSLLSTASEVATMQEELRVLQPQLEVKSEQVAEMIKQIERDTLEADEVRRQAATVAEQATQLASECKVIAEDAERDLAEALPALEAATEALKLLNRNDIVEVRAMARPPEGVKLVLETVCVFFKIKPKMVDNPAKVGQKIPDYWEPGKGLLQDPGKFLSSLLTYDKDTIEESTIQKTAKYMDNPEFQPERVAQVSKACKSISLWVRAMFKYYHVSREVEPKRARLRESTAKKEQAESELAAANARLKEVEEKIADLQAKYAAAAAEKAQLEERAQQCRDRLARAEKLIGGLGGERVRWTESVKQLEQDMINLVGDVLISTGILSYGGPFTAQYRSELMEQWSKQLGVLEVPRSKHVTVVGVLGDPVAIRAWTMAGLPTDSFSIENGLLIKNTRRWPLMIDPQGQANKWIKNMNKEAGLDTIKLSQKDFLRTLENGIRFGKPILLENVEEELDAALEPVLLQSTFIQQGTKVIRIGDNTIPYHPDFRFFVTTKLPNPHYRAEVSVKVTLVNFTINQAGLQDQLLGIVVEKERPDLETQKAQLVTSNASMRRELKEIEDQILFKLSNVQGNILDDLELIDALAASKLKSQEIAAKVEEAEQTEAAIDAARALYVPVAERAAILFFCVADMANVDPMYQNSLQWFINLFVAGIANAQPSDDVSVRLVNLNDYITYSLYNNVCRSLFEKHKLLFSLLLCTRIMQGAGRIDADEWRFLIAGASAAPVLPNPAADWLVEKSWGDVEALDKLPAFAGLAASVTTNTPAYRGYFDAALPHEYELPSPYQERLSPFQRLLVLRCLRPDKMEQAVQAFVAHEIGQRFIEPPTFNLEFSFRDSTPMTPLIFVLSAGADPAEELNKFAQAMHMSDKMSSISLGQGQGPVAKRMLLEGMERGTWVLLQNCHLAPSWMPELEKLVEDIDGDKVDRNFRLWLTSMPSDQFPVSVLQTGIKMTNEPPKGLRANLLRSFMRYDDNFLNESRKPEVWKKLLYSLCFFHANIQERRKFGPLGWNITYEFTTGDLDVCVKQLQLFLETYDEVPYKVIKFLSGQINYGGRVTDDWDRRTLMTTIDEFVNAGVLTDAYAFSESGTYRSLTAGDLSTYLHGIKQLPLNPAPEVFGLHENADIACAQNETWALFETLLLLQPRVQSGGGKSRDEILADTATDILERTPKPFEVHAVQRRYPVKYEESMNTVLVQECIRYNRVLVVVRKSLADLLKALKGLVVMSEQLEKMSTSLFNNQVPDMWASKAFPSLKPLAQWVLDLLERCRFIQTWVDNGIPAVFWFSGFYFPQAFLTGTLQNFARKHKVSIDRISFDFKVLTNAKVDDFSAPPEAGCLIRGLFVEGARWDRERHVVTDSRPKELYTEMPIMHLEPVIDRVKPATGIYDCPCYKILTRRGTLSTTGHSTNFVLTIELPSDQPQSKWIKAGVALFCALAY